MTFQDGPGGKMLKKWVNQTDNNAYSALTFQVCPHVHGPTYSFRHLTHPDP